ncbi:MAG: PIN domain-containing protein [Anaerolineae bacterium]|nr:PIN domain-containing protein [Anaerolineae bacterium]
MTTTQTEAVFVDTNVLTRATIAGAPLHQQALAALDRLRQSGTELWISGQVIREYMVNASRTQTYSPSIPMPQILEQVRRFRAVFRVAEEQIAVLDQMLILAAESTLRGKQLHDLNIVATMITYNIPRLLTHNVDDFRQFGAHIRVISLTDNI